MRYVLIVVLLSIYGCATISTQIGDDATSFASLAQKYGSVPDQACAKGLMDVWQKITAIDAEPTPTPSLLSDTYKLILLSRLTQIAQVQGGQDCGHFAFEILVLVGKTANKFRR